MSFPEREFSLLTQISSMVKPILVGPFVPPILVGGGGKNAPPLEMSLKTKSWKNPGQKS